MKDSVLFLIGFIIGIAFIALMLYLSQNVLASPIKWDTVKYFGLVVITILSGCAFGVVTVFLSASMKFFLRKY